MSSTSKQRTSTALIHEGWDHLKSQRPLAAWGSWQRCSRADPDSVGGQAGPRDPRIRLGLAAGGPDRVPIPRAGSILARRAAWDDRMQGWNAGDLEATADLFGRLATETPADSAAWYNRALCLAWLGKNREAIACLDRVVGLEAESAFDQAVDAWTLAEVLRQGGGAETPGRRPAVRLHDRLEARRHVVAARRVSRDPASSHARSPGRRGRRQFPRSRCSSGSIGPVASSLVVIREPPTLPIVLASVYHQPDKRFGSRALASRPSSGSRRSSSAGSRMAPARSGARRRRCRSRFSTPIVWIFRIPPEVDPDLADQLQRESVEQYFENQWIHRPRHGLDDRSPLAAARQARRGDAVARAKLTAVVRLREQLGSRPSARASLPGLSVRPAAAAPRTRAGRCRHGRSQDLGCAAPDELDRLDPAALDDSRLWSKPSRRPRA